MARKIAAYARISTNHLEQRSSLDSQKNYFLNEVIKKRQEYSDCEMVEVYADSKTATKLERPGFVRMMTDAGIDFIWDGIGRKKRIVGYTLSDREPKFQRILVTNVSRLSRVMKITGILEELVKNKVYVDFIDNGWTTEKEEHITFIDLFFSIAASESRDRSSKVKSGLEKTAIRGKLFSVHNLYGYNYQDKQLTIDEQEAQVIRMIFQMYVDGYGTRRIKQYLDSHNIKTRNNNSFEDATLRGILKNEKYAGILYRNKTEHGRVHSKKKTVKDKSEWISSEQSDYIPPIISIDLFNKVQEIRNRKSSSETKRGVNTGTSRYAGILFCGKCNSSMTRSTQYDKQGNVLYHFYQCSNKKKNGKKACQMIRIQEDWIDEMYSQYMTSNMKEMINERKSDWVSELVRLKNDLLGKIDNQDQAKANRLNRLLMEISERKKRLAKLFVMGTYSEEELEEMTAEIDHEYLEVEEKYKKATATNADIMDDIDKIDEAIKQVNEYSGKNIDNKEALSKIWIRHLYHFDATTGKTNMKKQYLEFRFELNIYDKLYQLVDKYFDKDVKRTYESENFLAEIDFTREIN